MATITHPEYLQRKHFPYLDGLRAVAVLLVFGAHVHESAINRAVQGVDGVVLFFVVSGFLITSLALREESGKGRLDLRAFAIRRAYRILPLYYMVLAVYVVLMAAGFDDRTTGFFHAMPSYLFYFQEHPHFSTPGLPFELSWSLGIEEKFYVVWPLLAFVALATVRRLRLPTAIVLGVACTFAPLLGDWGRYLFFYGAVLWGCAAALWLHDERGFAQARSLGRPLVLWSLVAATVVTKISTAYFGIAARGLLPVSIALTLCALMVAATKPLWWLEARPLVVIGVASYAIYLTHQIPLQLIEKTLPGHGIPRSIVVLILGGALACVAGVLIQRYVESPITERGRRRAKRLRPRPVATPAVAGE